MILYRWLSRYLFLAVTILATCASDEKPTICSQETASCVGSGGVTSYAIQPGGPPAPSVTRTYPWPNSHQTVLATMYAWRHPTTQVLMAMFVLETRFGQRMDKFSITFSRNPDGTEQSMEFSRNEQSSMSVHLTAYDGAVGAVSKFCLDIAKDLFYFYERKTTIQEFPPQDIQARIQELFDHSVPTWIKSFDLVDRS